MAVPFPTNIAKIIVPGYKETFPKRVNYLGSDIHRIEKPTVSGTILVNCEDDLEDFTNWYVNDTEYGKVPFTYNFPFLGTVRDWEMQFDTDLTGSAGVGFAVRKIPFTATIQNF